MTRRRHLQRALGSRFVAVLGCAVLALVSTASAHAAPKTATTAPFRPGAPGVGDPYFPLEGNGGYHVGHYDLDLRYDPPTHHLAAVADISARATQNLSRFDLDFSGLTVRGVEVDGHPAGFVRVGQELRITPPTGLRSGASFQVAVSYDGSPTTITGSAILGGSDYGWLYTSDGVAVGAEPDGARTWFPCNDHPSDKATFTFRVTVPSTRQVVANGELAATVRAGRSTTYVWHETRPMATYLATIDIGRWVFRSGTTPGGIPETLAVDPALAADTRRYQTFTRTAAITDYWSSVFGTYPFTSTGAIVDRAPRVLFSLETQTRPLYAFAPWRTTMAHELAHQWFGDSVSVRTWRDTWLNEGFATFAQGLWAEHTGHRSTYDQYRSLYRSFRSDDTFWQLPIADPQRDAMFSYQIYLRGAMTLAALRHRIGDTDFFTLLRTWTAQHRYANADTADFIQLAEQVSGTDLRSFFHMWLYAKAAPPSFDAHGS